MLCHLLKMVSACADDLLIAYVLTIRRWRMSV